MKKQYILIIIAVALVINAILLGIITLHGSGFSLGLKGISPVDSMANPEWRQSKAEAVAKKFVCQNLYFPDSFDPVEVRVDSLQYGYMTDQATVSAAIQLIDSLSALERTENEISNAERDYLNAKNTLKICGSSGVFWDNQRIYDKAKEKYSQVKTHISTLKNDIEQLKNIIKKRDTSQDGKFIGWQVYCRYRARTNNGTIIFGNALFLLDKQMQNLCGRYTIDDGNKDLDDIRKQIESVLTSQT